MTTAHFTPTVPPILPADPRPLKGPIGFMRAAKSLARDPLECVTEDLLVEPIVEKIMFDAKHLFVSDPAVIRQICKTNMKNYPLGYWRELMFRRMMPKGIISLSGERWSASRKLMNPAFSPRALNGFAKLMQATAARHGARVSARIGETVDLSIVMQELALDILLDSLIAEEDQLDRVQLVHDSDTLAQIGGKIDIADILRLPAWMPRPFRRKQTALTGRIAAAVRTVLDKRRSLPSDETVHHGDFLSLLMNAEDNAKVRFSDEEIIDNLLTIIGAGHETTARSLGWTFYLLSQVPELLRRLEAEIAEAPLDDLSPETWPGALPFTEAVIKESLRLFPPAPDLSRTTLEDDQVGELKIAAGTEIHISPWLIHRHRALWDNPDQFDPERFLGDRGKRIDRYQYIPFSTGPRVCIGGAFAMTEMIIIVATFARQMRFSYVAETPPVPTVSITVRPDKNLLMRVSKIGDCKQKARTA